MGTGYSNRSRRPDPGRKFGRVLVIVTLAAAFLVGACALFGPGEPATPDVDTLYTQAAQTLRAELTQEAAVTAVVRLTQTAISSIPTAVFLTPTPSPTQIPPLPTPTTIPPTPTSLPPPCDWAQFVADISAPPGSVIPAETGFVKTWRVQNIGNCTWTTAYSLIRTSGDPMGAFQTYPIPGVVTPGDVVDLSVILIAPAIQGVYQAEWSLRNAAGRLFGVGFNASQPLRVSIQSIRFAENEDTAYDLGTNVCSAMWNSSTTQLGCPGSSIDPNGSVVILDSPTLETGQVNRLSLWTRPNSIPGGYISGQYPTYTIMQGDSFVTEIGCLQGSSACDVTFQVDYRTINGGFGRLGSWRETFNGQTTPINIDLSGLVGQSVQFILTVINNGGSQDANAFWLEPRVQRNPNMPVLVWRQEESGGVYCDELWVYNFDNFSGEAQAFTCTADRRDLGRTALTSQEINQLRNWVLRLKSFDAEVYQATTNQPIIAYFNFSGQGSADAVDSDIQAINNFAIKILQRIIQ